MKYLSEKYIKDQQNVSLLEYVREGYSIFDFSNCKNIVINNKNNMKVSFVKLSPKFYRDYSHNKEIRSVSQKIEWIKVEEEEKKKNIFLSITSINNDNNNSNCCYSDAAASTATMSNNISFGVLSHSNDNLKKQLKFKTARDVNIF